MKAELEKVYQDKDKKKNQLLSLKNKYLGIIYNGVLTRQTARQIHKALYDATINKKVTSPAMLKYAMKLTNRAKKLDNNEKKTELSGLILPILIHNICGKIINTELRKQTGKEKERILKDFIKENREQGKWFYLASSHSDCAKDHLAYQGKVYVDEKAPDELKRGFRTIQWVIDDPVYFVTRPNCRHFFVAIDEKDRHRKDLASKYKTYSREGDRDFSTPAKQAVEEYQARLATLRTLYAKYPTEKIKRMIEKTELLIKKWKKLL